ncbi:hypothetical protein [Aquitalea sp.]|uniref:hypothetical protein n=2 Tax=Aquitalea TaxID=407217 RepID=UPI00258F962A|nr:hypothetical protein [Aquitalea sp.]
MKQNPICTGLLALALLAASPLLCASTFLGDSSMFSIDASGLSIYTSSMGGGNAYYAAHYRVKDIAYQGAGQYRMVLACAAPCVDLTLPVTRMEVEQLRLGDGVHASPMAYGVAFDLDRTGAVIALLVNPDMAGQVRPVRVM